MSRASFSQPGGGASDGNPRTSLTGQGDKDHTHLNRTIPSFQKKEMLDKEKVWISDPHDGFILGRIVDLTDEGALVEHLEGKRMESTVSFEQLYPCEDENQKDVDDNCSLMFLNQATLLNNVRIRYERNKIYTYVANILIAVNPYYEIPKLYDSDTIKSYQGRSLGTMPPHVFAIADKSFRDMKVLRQSQSIIVSGESGAGKTESTKYILKYLCDSYGVEAGPLEQKLLNANPILEAFGNAKTTRNNNSSRFGKFIEIHFDSKCKVVGGYISHYLLERARVVSQSLEERNYHIFYQLCAGAPESMKQQLHLGTPDDFRYLKMGCTRYFCSKETDSNMPADRKSKAQQLNGALRDPIIDDCKNFVTVDQDLKNLGLSDSERLSIYTTIAAVLHLGNIDFEDDPDDNRGGCRVTSLSESSLSLTANLLGTDCDDLQRSLTFRMMQTNKQNKGTIIMVPLKTHEASNARDALAKSIYSRLFDFIVKKINESIPFEKSSYYIGILDIAGFEYFTVNSFEQFCINYCNEKLQQFFNQRILKDEQELYDREGLGVKKISFVDNQDCIDLIEAKGNGIFSLLDEESKLPKPSHQHFTTGVHNQNSNHFRLTLPRKSKLKEHREIRDDDGFLVRHFAGAVCYETANFIEKNNDALHASLEAIVQECSNEFISSLFDLSEHSESQKGKLTFISVGTKFKRQLEELMEKLRSTGTNFIRCIKPNVKMIAHQFEGGSILSQLQCAGMTSVLELMQQGYPSRTLFSDLYKMYQSHLPKELARLDPRLFCKSLFKALGLDEKDFKFGLTKAFFRPGKFAEFDQMLRSDPENLRQLVARVKKWLLRSRWRKSQWCALSVIKLKNKILYRQHALLVIQTNARKLIAMKRHRHRYLGIIRLKKLQSNVELIGQMAVSLKEKQSVIDNVQRIFNDLELAIAKIKVGTKISVAEIDSLYTGLTRSINIEIEAVKHKVEKQRVEEEKERIRKIQEQMDLERQRKEAEEEKIRQQEIEKKKKSEIEVRRKDEEDLIRQMEKDREAAEKIQLMLNEENRKLREQLEQERRDHELALRLAIENNSSVDELQVSNFMKTAQQKDTSVIKPPQPAKYDLSKWKYAELRDTINTSCDIELLEACREEFHRRLKVYHAWKAKNRKKNATPDGNSRLPSSIIPDSTKHTVIPERSGNQDQRFFRIPFVRPEAEIGATALSPSSVTEKGWWYAHFDGDWIARQMEIHPNRNPVLLLAGRDDMQMCELSLQETGLTRKRGAEILDQEFEREWVRNGGPQYLRQNVSHRRN